MTAAADKQKRYRERKKKQNFLSNAYGVTRVMGEAKKLGKEAEMAELFDYVYDVGGPILAERTAFLIYGYVSLAAALAGADQPAKETKS